MENSEATRRAVTTEAMGCRALSEKARIRVLAQAPTNLGLVYLLLVLNALDVLTTHIGLQLGAIEANPIVAGLMGGVGEAATYAIKLSIVLAAALFICKLGKLQFLRWLNLVMATIVVSNLAVFGCSLAG